MNKIQYRGIDISSLLEVERHGGHFYNQRGKRVDLLRLAADRGVNLVRLRIWDNPCSPGKEPYGGGECDVTNRLELGTRAAVVGLPVLIDLHYSDFWVDPRKQYPPKSWPSDYESIVDKVEEHTRDVVKRFLEAGVSIQGVQVGNEITNGMIWPHGALPKWNENTQIRTEDKTAWQRLATLIEAGLRGIRSGQELSKTPIESWLHLDYGGDIALYQDWFGKIAPRISDWEVIALSYYPFWHGGLADLEKTLNYLSEVYGKALCVAETSYGYAVEHPNIDPVVFHAELAKKGGYPPSPLGQRQYLMDLRKTINRAANGLDSGFIYWEPAWLAVPGSTWATKAGMEYAEDHFVEGNSWWNQALFDKEGRALPAWDAFAASVKED